MNVWRARFDDSVRPRLPLLSRVFRYSFMFFLVAVLVYQVIRDWNSIRGYPWRLNWLLFASAFLLYTTNLALTAYVWKSIMEALSGVTSYWTHLRFMVLSIPARRLPSPVWYMGVRAASYQPLGVSHSTTVSAVLIETMVTNIGALIVVLVSLGLVTPNYSVLWVLALLIPAGIVTFKPALLIRGLNFVLSTLRRPVIQAEVRRTDMLRWLPVATLMFLVGGFMLFVLIDSVYLVPVSALPTIINAFAVAWLVGSAADFLFFIPNAAIRQLTLAYLLTACLPLPVAIGGTLLLRVSVLGFEMFWALVFTKLKL
jgi:hypothetical protein